MLNVGFSKKKTGENPSCAKNKKLNSNMASSMKTEPATQANALTTAPTKFSRDKNGTIVRIDILTFERRPALKRVRYVIKTTYLVLWW